MVNKKTLFVVNLCKHFGAVVRYTPLRGVAVPGLFRRSGVFSLAPFRGLFFVGVCVVLVSIPLFGGCFLVFW